MKNNVKFNKTLLSFYVLCDYKNDEYKLFFFLLQNPL